MIRVYWNHADHISHTQSMVAKRGRSNRADVRTLYVKTCLKHRAGKLQSTQQFKLNADTVTFWALGFYFNKSSNM